jgi:hypothetical protein
MAAYGTGYYGLGAYSIGNVVISGNASTGAVGNLLETISIISSEDLLPACL